VHETGAERGFNYTALRPQFVAGPTPGALNVFLAIGVCAVIRSKKTRPNRMTFAKSAMVGNAGQ
jgi:hypothetical protein